MSEQATSSSRPMAASGKRFTGSGSKAGMVAWLVVLLVLLAIGGLWFWQIRLSSFEKEWQAIFLSNGQVYFGQVKKENFAEIILEDIYYLQVTRPLQQTQDGEQPANPQGELSLVKLGNELHGPTDTMFINREHVLFIE